MPIKIEIPDAGDLSATECRALRAMLDVIGAEYAAPTIADALISKSRSSASDANYEPREVRTPVRGGEIVLENLPAIKPEDSPAAGIDTDATLQAAGFGGNVAGGTETGAPIAAVPAAGAVPPAPPAMPSAPPVPGIVPGPAPTGSTGGVPRDNKGMPWDHRIHSKERTQNKDGTWRYKRGLPEGEVERVEAELRTVLGVAAPPPPAWPFPAPGTPAAPMTFMTLLSKTTKAIKDGQLTQDTVNAALVEFSLPNLPAIHYRPDLAQAFHDRLFGGV